MIRDNCTLKGMCVTGRKIPGPFIGWWKIILVEAGHLIGRLCTENLSLTLVYRLCPDCQVATLSYLVVVEFIDQVERHKDGVSDKFPMHYLSIIAGEGKRNVTLYTYSVNARCSRWN